jgi:glycosyltransferase involved in cell wall biosynthesis
MDIVMQPSIGDEGFSLTVIEAMSCGKPVIGTPSGGTPEILTDGEVGFIVPKHDEKLLAEKTITLIKNKDLTATMGEKARQRVLERFTWEKVVPGLIEVYEGVLDGHIVVP